MRGRLDAETLGGVSVRFYLDSLLVASAGVAAPADGAYPPGDRTMERRGDEGAGLGDELATLHPLAHAYHGFGRGAQMLAHRERVALHERHALRGQGTGLVLELVRMDAMGETAFEQGCQGVHGLCSGWVSFCRR